MANNDKNRKSEAQERFDEADNAGRFAGRDNDARAAKEAALCAGAKDTPGYNSAQLRQVIVMAANPEMKEQTRKLIETQQNHRI